MNFQTLWNKIPFLPKMISYKDGPCRKHYFSSEPFYCEKCGWLSDGVENKEMKFFRPTDPKLRRFQ